jgi:SAM-dependent methyltransferase
MAPIHERVVDALAPRPEEQFLDLACGTGAVALVAARTGAQVVGLDISADQLRKAREVAAEAGLEIQFDEGDCQELPYADGSFDAMASVFGLIFASSHARAAAELARVSPPGGRLALTAWLEDDWARLGDRLGRSTTVDGDEALEWGREEYARDMLGGHFDLRFASGEWAVDGSQEEIWELVSSSAPPLKLWLASLDAEEYANAKEAYMDLFSGGELRRPYLLVVGSRR